MPLLLRLLKTLGGFAALWLLIWVFNNFGCQKVEGGEMEPTLKREAHKSVEPKIRLIEQLAIDDLISYSYTIPGKPQPAIAARVIGMPGDRVAVKGGEVYVNGSKIGSNYVASGSKSDPKENLAEIIVPRESVYVLCDNRRSFDKFDSRGIGPVDLWAINGKFK